ncbi:IS200/IS605 family element transposase accessory protein TnpB [Planktothrix sp. FACHB-1355]|uniref:RNA-guided endonuclease InsQ/TnpB family protein n=1 Tax=Planktothrix sp. FACHB-1355 TaxID=2692854 RepID=UPI00168BEFA3|nr:RNA-guided endonuclease TnpB family protein [Planktothrix sp. FACHB-1355]MBD3557474.1 IS200/IS605 family element transposase accessory protein TnpB [Planktothrix sp. FACHB-1355]
MLSSFQTKLDLNNQQRTLAAKHAGVARHAWNWGLEICLKALSANEKLPSAITLHKRLVAEVKSANPWYYEVSKCAPQQALRNLSKAFGHFFKVSGRGQPKFKKKNIKDSFYLEGSIAVSGNRLKLPIFGWVRCHEILPAVKPKNVTVTKRASDWYVSFRYELEAKPSPKTRQRIGVDIGINSLATCSDGSVFPNVKAYRQKQRKLAHLQRSVCRKLQGSRNRTKANLKVARLHKRIANIRQDALHKLTSWLAKNHSEIVIEDLNISGMLKNHRLASAIADSGFYEFKRQLEYKASWYGATVIKADKFYPSSQLCSCCHHRQKMPLSARIFKCVNCGIELDRDFNASVNLENWHKEIDYPLTVSSTGIACGGSHQLNGTAIKDSMKQEGNVKLSINQAFEVCE